MKLTNHDRKIVRQWLYLYQKAPLYPITEKSLRRTALWASGKTMTEIANIEQVGLGRISHSVRTLAHRVIEFAEGVSK